MDQREVLGDRRAHERRARLAFRPGAAERRSGFDRRAVNRRNGHGDRRFIDDRRYLLDYAAASGRRRTDGAVPPLSRLIPALVLVAVSVIDLGLTRETGGYAWSSLLVVACAFPIAGYGLAQPPRWRLHLGVMWFAVCLYAIAVGLHITWMLRA